MRYTSRAYEMQAAEDEQIVARAIQEGRIIASADSDFSAILAAQEDDRPSFILFREPDFTVAGDYLTVLVSALRILEPELSAGCVAVFRRGRLRVRRLAFSA